MSERDVLEGLAEVRGALGSAHLAGCYEAIDEAAAEIRRLREDSERLDWLAVFFENAGGVIANASGSDNAFDLRDVFDEQQGHGATFREAIDAAMAAERESEGG
jgi:hypothetical protein